MENKSARAKVQAFGGFLTAMVIPNIGAFIAWGFITALFIPTGWMPNEHFAKIVGPMITYLLPVMIGSTGGHLVGGKRGAVMGGIGSIGVIVGADIPMFLGAMVMGPLGGWVIKHIDRLLEKRIPAGFEMVINNFSLGIAGMLLCLLGFEVIGPAVLIANNFVKECIEALVHAGYLPLLSVINEPAKILFLNNAIDQGVYYPLGMQQASETGKSIFFMVASNPGPGLGLLLGFAIFGKGMSKKSAPGAMIIHFLGGIHDRDVGIPPAGRWVGCRTEPRINIRLSGINAKRIFPRDHRRRYSGNNCYFCDYICNPENGKERRNRK
jgi:PTS system mannitol-specific IIC component